MSCPLNVLHPNAAPSSTHKLVTELMPVAKRRQRKKKPLYMSKLMSENASLSLPALL